MGSDLARAEVELARRTSRRSFLGTVGRAVVALAGGPFVAVALAPERAEAHHICGHIFTTGSCPHPYAPRSRVDAYGFPVHPKHGYPVDDDGRIYTDIRQRRRKVCQARVPDEYPGVKDPRYGGGWSRCCDGRVRHIQDCCSSSRIRINGDPSVRGYCPKNLRVFCITYRELNVAC
ncbi:MAG: twin-arginine translocation signal domain-containing protein [Actinomycetota bacterium]